MKTHGKPPSMRELSLKVALTVIVIVALAGSAYLFSSHVAETRKVEEKVLTEARTLNKQMQAAWDYIDDSQISINTDRDGVYNFKHVYCAVAGKGIARRFTQNSDGYVIRYVRDNPRTGTDKPDAFEQRALDLFAQGNATEYYEITEYEDVPALRYSSVLTVRNNCLECHGSPAGEKDVVGFIKEGMEIGDIAGAVSIVIPIDAYIKQASDDKLAATAFFISLALLISISLALVLRYWVAAPLEQANEQLNRENEDQANFLAVMSHELRTPLSSIIAFTDIWEKNGRPKDEEEESLVRKIKDSSTTLLGMINNTIDAARLESGQLTVQIDDVDLVDVVGAVFAVTEPLALKQNIELTKDIDPAIPVMRTDGEALRKILTNLVSNALKFTPEKGLVVVTATLLSGGDSVRISVADTGTGIAEEDREAIFEKFSQANTDGASVGKTSGSGLGLYLVKSLAEQLGGEVQLESTVGVGSVFTVTLPVTKPENEDERDDENSAS